MKKQDKILFLAPLYLPGLISGSEVVVRDLAEGLIQLDKDVVVVTSDGMTGRRWYIPFFEQRISPSEETIHGVTVIRLPCRPFISLGLFFVNKIMKATVGKMPLFKRWSDRIEILSWGPILSNLERTIVSERPSIVSLSPFPAGICLSGKEICKKHRIPYSVIPFFKKDQKLFENHLLGQILDEASVIFTPTNTEKKYIRQFTANNRIFILPSSIDTAFIKAHTYEIRRETEKLRRRFAGDRIILFAGNKGVGKGIIDAAEAVKRLERHDIVFVAMGHGSRDWQTYYRQRFGVQIVDLPYLTGPQKYAYFALCDALILPSTTDNFPLVFLEAWQFKKPVIAYDYYSMRELVGDGSGLLAKPRDIADLTRVLRTVLDDHGLAQRIGTIGYNKVSRFTIDRVVRQYFLPAFKTIL